MTIEDNIKIDNQKLILNILENLNYITQAKNDNLEAKSKREDIAQAIALLIYREDFAALKEAKEKINSVRSSGGYNASGIVSEVDSIFSYFSNNSVVKIDNKVVKMEFSLENLTQKIQFNTFENVKFSTIKKSIDIALKPGKQADEQHKDALKLGAELLKFDAAMLKQSHYKQAAINAGLKVLAENQPQVENVQIDFEELVALCQSLDETQKLELTEILLKPMETKVA